MPEECHQDAQGCGLDRSDSVNSTNFVVNIMYRLMVYRLIYIFFLSFWRFLLGKILVLILLN